MAASEARQNIRFGVIGLGLMGREFASSLARWCHLLDDSPKPVLSGICDINSANWEWFHSNFNEIVLATEDYHELIASKDIDAVYCAVPHHLHEQIYIDILQAGKHLLGEKPFGIDQTANRHILQVVRENPALVVRCTSQFPYFPAVQRLIRWIRNKRYGRLMEVRCGFHHASDMDLNKPINWKRMVRFNGQYGCMGDLGLHTQHIPFRMGWRPVSVYADLQKIVETRPDASGIRVPCETWDNAVLMCKSLDPDNGKEFSMVFETKRMAPGATNTWFIEVLGTEGSARFSTHEPKAFYSLQSGGKEQGWTRVDVGSQSAIPSISGNIFEFGFSDAVQQMIGAYMTEFRRDGCTHPFPTVTPQETGWSHRLMTAALESHRSGRRVEIEY